MSGLAGQTLDQYRLIEAIGQGGMATVYRAQDTRSQREVAVKVLSSSVGGDRRFVRRFRREAAIATRLNHPHILPVLAYGEARGVVYLVMPFVRGPTLQDVLSKRRPGAAETARWIGQVATALDFAHRKGVIHRDVKPSNVLIDDHGRALLTDFGLARLVEGTGTLTGSMLMGTPAYVSPEQARGQPVDARTDQYALGVILYQIAVGRLPFDADTPMGTVLMHIQQPVPRPRSLNPELPPAVEAVILKALAKERADRFPSVGALGRAYQEALTGAAPGPPDQATVAYPSRGQAAPAASGRMLGPYRPARRGAGWLIALVVVVALAGLAFFGGPALLDALQGARPTPLPAGLPGSAPTIAVGGTPTPPPAALATATEVASAACPGVRLASFRRDGQSVIWVIDNGGDAPVRLLDLGVAGPQDNLPRQIWLGGDLLWEQPEGAPALEQAIALPSDDRSLVAGQSTKQLRLQLVWEDLAPGYTLELRFDAGCTLSTSW